ncbi:hypothetical protein HETIRDRAFT_430247 [Heterobasidion irregulare TC 32-1]|uniref:Uncharacterized protein n=1 Tax=Heterobasidion irregulare (strain TC 32-1) TaxID=747525 RepID=W4JQ81_HETIT|nr:uncharacterized protein HETIRDRAFT_430247 [Heterobasidion irregulare TC 32-1]ETW75693.1 hypothetical protein HETIRDRAFT_430247 [Heterobasidion irregulare TC 32-1]
MCAVYTIAAGIHIVTAGMCLGFDLIDQMQQASPIMSMHACSFIVLRGADLDLVLLNGRNGLPFLLPIPLLLPLLLYLTSSHHDHLGSGSIYGIVTGAGMHISTAGEGQGKPG